MEASDVKAILEAAFSEKAQSVDELHVKGDGSHFEVIAVAEMFDGMSRVKKQQTIYGPLTDHIARNDIHAVSIKAMTPAEWARDKKLMQL